MPAPAAVTVSPMLELEVALTQPEKRLSRADPILTSASIAAGVLANVRIKSKDGMAVRHNDAASGQTLIIS
jgi:hypothetical protein